MKRFNFWLEEKWLKKLEKEKAKYGFTTIASFIRFIIITFFKQKDKL